MRQLQLILSGLLILLFSGCSSTQTTPISKLIGKPWILSSLMGQAPDPSKFPSGLPTLNFLEGESLAGFAGCNNFSGEYKLQASTLKLVPGAMTRKACPGSGESEFLAALENVKNLGLEKEKLILMDGTTELMSFVPKKD